MSIEDQVIDSNIDAELKNEISSIKLSNKKIPMKYIYIASAVLGVIILGILIYFLAFRNIDVTFSFSVNNEPVKENLLVNLSYDDFSSNYTTDKDILQLTLPKGKEVLLEIKTLGYVAKKTFIIDSDSFKFEIPKTTNLNLNNSQAINVKFYVYDEEDQFNLFSNAVNLNLKCLSSNKEETISVSGTYDYSKASDCGYLSISTQVPNYIDYKSVCTETTCNIKLKKAIESPESQNKNTLIIKTIRSDTKSTIPNVKISVSKAGFANSLTTDSYGIAEFSNVDVGTYTVKADANYKGIIYSEIDNNVSVFSSQYAITKVINFDFIDGNYMSLTIDANADLKCNYFVDIFYENDALPIAEYLDADANTEIKINTKDWNSGNYYLSVVPEPNTDCATIYAPVYNKSFAYPKEAKQIVTMEKFDSSALVLLDIYPKLNSAKVKNTTISIRESDNNRILISGLSNSSGVFGTIVLYQNTDYNIIGENGALYGELNYNFDSSNKELNDDNFYYDTLNLPLTVSGADVKIDFSFDGNKNDTFKLYATWKDAVNNNERTLDFDGNDYIDLEVPAKTPILFKVVKEITENNETGYINYYLNKLYFDKDTSTTINVDINTDIISSMMIDNVIGYEYTYYNDSYLNAPVKDSKISNNKLYYVPFDVLAYDYNSSYDDLCVANSKEGYGFVFFAKPSEDTKFNIVDILSYTTANAEHSTLGLDFMPVFVQRATNNKEINIFRVLSEIYVNDIKTLSTANLEYGVSKNLEDYTNIKTNDFTVSVMNSKDKLYYNVSQTLDVNIYTPNEGKINLPISEDLFSKIYGNQIYSVNNYSWLATNANTACDKYVDDLSTYLNLLGLDDLTNATIDKENNLVKTINVNKSELSKFNKKLMFDVVLDLNVISEDNKVSQNFKLPLSIRLTRGDKPTIDCLEIYAGNKKLDSKYIFENNSAVGYLNNTKVSSIDIISKYDSLSDDEKTYFKDIKSVTEYGKMFIGYTSALTLFTYYDIFFNTNSASQHKSNLYDILFESAVKDESIRNIYFKNTCALWNFDISMNYSNGSGFNNASKSVEQLTETNTLLSDIYNTLIISSIAVASDDSTNAKEFSVQSAFVPNPIDNLLYGNTTNYVKNNTTGNILELATDNDYNCEKKICSADKFFDYMSNFSYLSLPEKSVYLSDDNFYNPLLYFNYNPTYICGKIIGNKTNQIVSISCDINDQVFYHIPLMSEFQGHLDNTGACSYAGTSFSYGGKNITECGSGITSYITLSKSKDSQINKIESLAKVLIADYSGKNISMNYGSGFKYKKLDYSTCNNDCYFDGNSYNVVDNNFDKMNMVYLSYINGHYYYPRFFYYYADNKLQYRTQGYNPQLIAITKDGQNDSLFIDVKEYSLLSTAQTGILDLKKIIDNYNKGNIYYSKKTYSNNESYSYVWDMKSILNNKISKLFDYKLSVPKIF